PRRNDRLREFAAEKLQLLQRAAVVVSVEGAGGGRGGGVGRGLGVGGGAARHEVALGEVGDHRHVAGAVAGRVGKPDRAVAEEVEAASEAGVGVDSAAVEVDRAVV